MVCGRCKRGIVLVSGNHGGYYGCVAARLRGCDNRVRVRRDLAEKIIVNALQERLADPRAISYVFEQLQQEVAKLSSHVPELIRRKREQLGHERRRLDNLIAFIADGRHSVAVRESLEQTEHKVSLLDAEIAELTRSSRGFRVPSLGMIKRRCANLRGLLDSSVEQSALVVRALLAPIRLDPMVSGSSRPYYVAHTTFDTLKLLEDLDPDGGSDPGATSFEWWTRQIPPTRPGTRSSGGKDRRPRATFDTRVSLPSGSRRRGRVRLRYRPARRRRPASRRGRRPRRRPAG